MIAEELLANTWEHHSDFEDLCNANNKMNGLAVFINKQKEKVDNIAKMQQVTLSLTNFEHKVRQTLE